MLTVHVASMSARRFQRLVSTLRLTPSLVSTLRALQALAFRKSSRCAAKRVGRGRCLEPCLACSRARPERPNADKRRRSLSVLKVEAEGRNVLKAKPEGRSVL